MRTRRSLLSIAAVLCLAPALATAGPLQDDLKGRRARAMERLGADTLAIFWSAPARVYSLDVDYEYRQDSNLLYLTGIGQAETILVLMPGNESRREILFVREDDARREHWDGHILTPAETTAYKHIGVRIEDSYLLTPKGLERLSASVPRGIDEIETFMKMRSQRQ